MNSIVTAVLISVISTVIVSLLTACVVFFKKQAKTYQGLLERERKDNLRNTVREELEPVIEEINRL
jgi:MFS superfamily sulfate permease-like transporter